MSNRREMLARSVRLAGMLGVLGLLPGVARAQAEAYRKAAFEARRMADVMKVLGAGAPVESGDLNITAADVAENGAAVPVSFSTTLPGVRRLLLLVEKNPAMLSAIFEVGDAVEAAFTTRIKMDQSSKVFTVAMLADGRVLYAAKDIRVTLGGCGD